MSRGYVFLGGTATLFCELALIRYVPGQIRVLGYFTNFVLLAAFLGFGVGMLSARRLSATAARRISWIAPAGVLAIVLATEALRLLHVLPTASEFLFLEYQTAGARVSLYVFLLIAFAILAAALIPVGVFVARTLAGDGPLARYGGNLLGSLFGILGFVVLSALSAPPAAWIAVACATTFVCVLDAPIAMRSLALACSIGATLVAWQTTRGTIWSPYQKIDLAPIFYSPARGVVQEWRLPSLSPAERAGLEPLPRESGFVVRVNDDSYQTPVDLSDAAVARRPGLSFLRLQYDLAFRRGKPPGDVLVLGAGTGNDVAAALRAGATRVDAVEIDPEILRLGAQHPERPYADPRVHAHVDDARSFLARTDRSFDMVVYGLLDSHVLQSAKGTVRLDSYVFTRESFALARRHLRKGGRLVVSHAVGQPWFVLRMRETLAEAFGRPPLVVSDLVAHPLGVMYAAGDDVPEGRAIEGEIDPLTDDWPFVYLRDRSIPRDYLIAIGLIAVASFAAVRLGRGRARGGSLSFFALGGGFLLLETRGLSVLSLLVGATWGVTSAVFAGVLVMAYLATVIAARGAERNNLWWIVLFAALATAWLVPLSALLGLPLAARIALGAVLVSAPLLASGVVFGRAIAKSGQADQALASNLLGALAGGLCEYAAMVVGLRALVGLAAVFYLIALLAERRNRL